jgi:hypothetical protein
VSLNDEIKNDFNGFIIFNYTVYGILNIF